MKVAALFRLVLLCLALLCIAAACTAQTAGTGSISGVVRDAATGAPVADAGVSLRLRNGSPVASRVDALGQYTLDGLPSGTYRVEASGPLEKGQTLAPQQEKTVRLGPGQSLAAIDFRLPSTSVIGGRVLDENKEPVPGVQVVLVEKRYDHGALRYALAGGRAQTDEAGVYRLTGVPADEVFLVETREQFPRKATELDTPADTFYPNVLSVESASEIVLGPGETRSGLDIIRAKLPAYCVDGTVEDAPESALALEFSDAAVVNSSHAAQQNPAGKTKPGGAFHFCGIHRGQYAFTAKGGLSAAMPFFAAGTLEVTNGDIRDFKLLPALMSPVSAEFILDGDPPANAPGPSGAVTLQGQRLGIQFSFGFGGTGSLSRVAMLLPDDYTVDLHAISGGWYAKSITCGGRSVLHGIAPLGGATSCGTLRFVFAHGAASLTARVVDKDGNPISDAYVAIVPESAATEAEMSASMTFGQTGPNGIYSASALPPGKYRVLATNETIDLAANRVDKLWAAQSRGQEVEIGANASVQVKLQTQ
jgi:hypothetical protein